MAEKKEVKELTYEEKMKKAKELEVKLIRMEKVFEKHAREIILQFIDIGIIPLGKNHNYGSLFNDCQMNYEKYKKEIKEEKKEKKTKKKK